LRYVDCLSAGDVIVDIIRFMIRIVVARRHTPVDITSDVADDSAVDLRSKMPDGYVVVVELTALRSDIR